jgi:uncharacterized protein YecE (DUF72 family)
MAEVMPRCDIVLRVGCAGWAIPSQHAHAFPAQGTHLERYAQRFTGVEVNSSFHRSHRPTTYARWAASVPDQFQFAVKMPKEITHTRRLVAVTAPLECFLTAVQSLGPKLGPLLLQLPPSLHFTESLAQTFLAALRTRFQGSVVCEPRHGSWFSPAAERLLHAFQVARVAADPARVPAAAVPGGWPGLVYYRWHGTPEMYVSAYPSAAVEALAAQVAAAARTAPTWCIFDNTACGAATTNALELLAQQTVAPTTPSPAGCGDPSA